MKYVRKGEWLLLAIDNDYHLKTVNEFLNDFHMPSKEQNHLMQIGQILLNSKKTSGEMLMQKGDTFQVKAFEEKEIDFIPEETEAPLKVEYEDEFILIVNKPRDMLVHPDSKDKIGTLANMVAYYYQQENIQTTIRPIHRLDVETMGLVIFSKCEFIQPKLDWMLMTRKIKRHYYAFVVGEVYDDGVIEAPIGRDRHDAKKYRVSRDGKPALTRYKVIRNKRNFTLLECVLETGRTHQIRVHLASIKHPIVSDALYGEKYDFLPMGLQAYKVEFKHPITDSLVHVVQKCEF